MEYKVIIERILTIEADSVEEAEDKAFDDDYLYEEQRITHVKKNDY